MSAPLPRGTDPHLQQAVDALSRESQKTSHTILTSTPVAAQIPQNGVVFAKLSGTMYLYTRDGTSIYRVAMTLV